MSPKPQNPAPNPARAPAPAAPSAVALERPPYEWAGLAAVLALALYIATIAPTTQFWDTSEYMAAAKVLGIPHPPGNPLFVLTAHLFGLLPVAASYGKRLNIFAALTSALSSGLLFLVAERFLRSIVPAKGPRLLATFAGILVGATSFTVWNQSVVNEKVYSLSLFSVTLVLWLTVRWGDSAPGPLRDRRLLLIGYLLALTCTIHMMGLLVAPAVLIYVLATDRSYLAKPWVLLLGLSVLVAVSTTWAAVISGPAATRGLVIVAYLAVLGYAFWKDPAEFTRPALYMVLATVAVGVSLNYAFLPIRAAHFPPINEGEPTNWRALLDVLNRVQYAPLPITTRQADFLSQLGNYWQYVTWQFGRDWGGRVAAGLAGGFVALGVAGAVRQWKSDVRSAFAMTALMFTVTIALVFYLNFKYGFSYPAPSGAAHEVRERDYFFIASFLLWGVWVAIGFGALMEQVAEFLKSRQPGPLRWYLASPVLLLALIPLAGNHLAASRAGETLPRDWAVDLLESVPPYSIVFTAGDNDTFPLWYAQEVEGVRKDVLLVNQSLAGTDWHLRQIERRPLFPFDSTRAASLWRGKTWTKPTEKPFHLTMEQLDQIPQYYPIPHPVRFDAGSIKAVIDSGYLLRPDMAALFLIRDNIATRPIYFARTVADWPERLGLSPYLVGEGMVRRVMPNVVQAVKDTIVAQPGVGWVNVPRTKALLFGVYHSDSATRPRPMGWLDTPSENILNLYTSTYSTFGALVEEQNYPTELEPISRFDVDADTKAKGALADSITAAILPQTAWGKNILRARAEQAAKAAGAQPHP